MSLQFWQGFAIGLSLVVGGFLVVFLMNYASRRAAERAAAKE